MALSLHADPMIAQQACDVASLIRRYATELSLLVAVAVAVAVHVNVAGNDHERSAPPTL